MNYLANIFMIIVIAVLLIDRSLLKENISKLEKNLQVQAQEADYNSLSKAYVPAQLNYQLLELKQSGQELEALKLLRDNSSFDWVMAKKFIDHL